MNVKIGGFDEHESLWCCFTDTGSRDQYLDKEGNTGQVCTYRFKSLTELGEAFKRYETKKYERETTKQVSLTLENINDIKAILLRSRASMKDVLLKKFEV